MKPLALVLLVACAPRTLPVEVTRLVERWQLCWHFAGEEPYDEQRQREIADGEAASCPGNDAERARLAAKYRDDAAVQRELSKLDAMK